MHGQVLLRIFELFLILAHFRPILAFTSDRNAVFTLFKGMNFFAKALGRQVLGMAGLCAVLLLPKPVSGQFSNEWINFTQTYYKVPVSRTGIYRITQSDLQAAGVPVGAIDPRRINLFHRGNEQAIFVQGQADAVFDPTDFIEFYGQRNDGTLDADLYKPSNLQPHPYYNLFNDTSAYFLTWNPLPVQGKRMVSFFEANGSGIPKETYHQEERLLVFSNEYSGGLTVGGEVQNTAFDIGEGWTGAMICTGYSGCVGQQDFIVDNLLRTVPTGGSPQLELLLVGRDEFTHQAEIYAGANGGALRLLSTATFNGFQTYVLNAGLNWSDIGVDGRMDIRIRLTASGTRDEVSVSYIKVNFPQDYDVTGLSEKTLRLPDNPSNKSYIEILNPAGARVWDITDEANIQIIGTTTVPGGIGAIVPSTLGGRILYVSNATLTTALKQVGFRSITPSLYNYIVISHRSLLKPALGYGNAVQAYAAYRASAAGGGYDTLTVSMDQLYNQFNYGETSPRAIYQFMKYLLSTGDPKFLFLIGKGLEVSQGFYRKTSLLSSDFRDLVPSAGMPAADMVFTAGFKGTTYEPAVPTGRLTASTALQVAAYLNKVKETEALTFTEIWRKDLLHLSGGIKAGETELFRQYVDGFKTIAEGFYLGGKAETISKQTLNVELINVKDQVNKGLNLITFFGHSGPGTIDIDIGNVSDPSLGYSNAGKYPGFLINGCNAGRFFDNRVTFGEDWILTPNKGAKTFIAHSSFGFTNLLKSYSDTFYSIAFGDSTFMIKGIGEVQKETARRLLSIEGTSLYTITQAQQMMLLGDPAVSLFGAAHPDYEINSGSLSVVSLDGKPVTAQSPSFALDISVRNFGRAEPGPLKITVTRTLSDNTSIRYDSTFSPVLYREVLRFVIRKGSLKESGNSNFLVSIDPQNTVWELLETNNNAGLNFFIPLNGTQNLFPPAYAVVNHTLNSLVFQTTDLQSAARSFKVEVDTAATFDSPYLKRQVVTGKVIATMPLTLLPADSVVYYWRTKLDKPLPDESVDWASSSFISISSSSPGWAQSKFSQLSEDPAVGLVKDPLLRQLKFQETRSTIDVLTFGSTNPSPFSAVSLKINQEEYNVSTQEQPCRINTLNLIAFDKSSTAPYAGIPFASFFDPRACGRAPQMINNFKASELETGNGDDLAHWVNNIKTSDSVVLFSIGDAGYASWSNGVKLKLTELGIGNTQLNGLQPGEPFVIFGKKGASAGTAVIFRPSQAPANAQAVLVNKTITGRFTEGSLTSTVIGPASAWSHAVTQCTRATPNDQFGMDVFGIDLSGKETLLKSNTYGSTPLSDINAGAYPYLKLVLQTKDLVDLTPVQLRHWMVYYTPMAEGLIGYRSSPEAVTVQEGQDWKADYIFRNISSLSFSDSLRVQVDVFSSEIPSAEKQIFRIKAPAPGDSSVFSVKVKTRGKAGLNDVTVFVNPRVLPEQYFDNNILPLYGHLRVEADQTPPLLDVTVDGRHVVDGDAVSSAPTILTSVIDRNPFIPKTDTTGVNLYLRYPCALENCTFTRINFSRNDVVWSPATGSSDFKIEFKPQSLAIGVYTLKAEAVDGSGNPSGTTPYEVSFEVSDLKKFVIQSVYPNPSSDRFYFKLLVSGPSAPEEFGLKIYSSSGSLVREFGNEVLGSIHVGTNDVSVEATDAGGSPLPAGVYLFRMTSVVGGRQFTSSGRLIVIR